jgi:hypothetical protein
MVKYFFAAGINYLMRKDASSPCRISWTTAERHSQAFGFGRALWQQPNLSSTQATILGQRDCSDLL